ncbi:transmembrane protease serine 9-like [Cochliomyia hominivorax]
MYKIFAIILIFFLIRVNGQYGTECKMPNKQKGLCVPVKSCKTTFELFSNIQKSGSAITDSDREKLLEFKCGEIKTRPLICCLESDVQLNVDGLAILKNTTCGIYSGDRVSNGVVAALFGFPWMALLKYDDDLTPFKCGGSLISDRYVLTAAHCISRTNKKLVAVRLGEHRISTEKDCTNWARKNVCAPPVEDVDIEDILLHEQYQKNLYHDIALLRLNRSVEIQRHIKPICLPIFDHLRSTVYSNYIISGWGATENRSFSDVLMVAIVASVERSQCQIELKKHYLRLPLTVGQICAGGGSNNVDTCRGDSGGPLGYKDNYDGNPRFIQFGVVSVGLDNCGYESPPTTYTNISHYLQWITDHMCIYILHHQYGSLCWTLNQKSGFCTPIKSCKTIFEILLQIEKNGGTISEENRLKLTKFHCGTFKNIPHVCCPKEDIQFNVDGLNILKRNACGLYTINTIANGQDAAPFQFPWMALLKYKDVNYPFKCGGTLISDKYILTAAHCIKGREHLLAEVRLGEYQISTTEDCTNSTRKKQCAPPVEDVGIEEMIIHEDFQNVYNDIALIRLNRKIEFQRHIKPICLPIYEHLRSKEIYNYIVTGWGKTEEGKSSDILRTAILPKVNLTECEQKLRKYNLRYPLNEGHICAGGVNLVDTCQGDSGGPLGYRDIYEENPRFIQFGIVSLGLYRCGVENVPGIYTNISHYIQWITDHLTEMSVGVINQG